MSRMQEKYAKEVAPALMEKFGYKSVMQIPKIEKIVEPELLKLLRMNIGDKPLKSESTILFKAVSISLLLQFIL